MKLKIKEFLKSASLLLVGGVVNIIINYLFLKDISLSILIESPKIIMSVLWLALWLFAWEKIEKIIKSKKSYYVRYCPKCAETNECGVALDDIYCPRCGTETILEKIKN